MNKVRPTGCRGEALVPPPVGAESSGKAVKLRPASDHVRATRRERGLGYVNRPLWVLDSVSLFCVFLFCFEVFWPLFWKVRDAPFCGYFRPTAVFPVSSWGLLLTQQKRSRNRQEAAQARPEIKKQFLARPPPPFTSPPMGTL